MHHFRIAYLLEDTELSGGVRVLLAQADALVARGHSVTILTKGEPVTWRHSSAEWLYVDDFSSVDGAAYDFVIGTFWTTVGPAYAIAGERAIHLCQGYEASFDVYRDIREQIERAYAIPIPKLVVTPYLIDICRRFVDEVGYIGQVVDDAFFQQRTFDGSGRTRILISGPAQAEVKGIDAAYGAVAHARWRGAEFDLVRVSPWAPAGHEPVRELNAEFHVALTTDRMARLLASCDILLATSRKEEGFGLPAAEAMASGLATVLTRIPSFLSFDTRHDYALFADEDDAEGLGERILELLADDVLRQQIARRGREVAEQFRGELVAERIESFLVERSRRLS